MDHLVGRIVGELDRMELRKQTVILFTGDNGTGGDGKGQTIERGVRVPLIVSCPGTVAAGVVSDELVDLTDVLPTLADFGGAKIPPIHAIDGKSLKSTLLGGREPHRPWIFSYLGQGRMLRDRRWLLEGDGKFYDCGRRRNGTGYKDVTDSADAEVVAARTRFADILRDLPGPDGHPGLVLPAKKAKKMGPANGR
jgi:arylsulfatase A-like enzyme